MSLHSKTIAIDLTITRATAHRWLSVALADQTPAVEVFPPAPVKFRVVLRPFTTPEVLLYQEDVLGAPGWKVIGTGNLDALIFTGVHFDHGSLVALAFSRLALAPEPPRRTEMLNGAMRIELGEI